MIYVLKDVSFSAFGDIHLLGGLNSCDPGNILLVIFDHAHFYVILVIKN